MKNLNLLTLAGLVVVLLLSSCMKEKIDQTEYTPDLSSNFTKYETVTINYDQLLTKVQSNLDRTFTINLDIPTRPDWNFTMSNYDLSEVFPDQKTYLVGEGNTLTEVGPTQIIALEGRHLDATLPTLFTLSEGVFEALIMTPDGSEYYIEPMRNLDKNAPQDLYVVYNHKDIIATEDLICDQDGRVPHGQSENGGSDERAWCHAVKVTQMADYQFYANKFASNYTNTASFMRTRLLYASYRYNTYNQFPLNFVDNVVYIYTFDVNYPNAVNNSATFVQQWDNFNGYSWFVNSPINYLWTGRNVSGVWGRADGIAKMCSNPTDEYSFGEKMASNYHSNNLMAHEIGHTLGAYHDNSSTNFMNSNWNNWNSTLGINARANLFAHINSNNGCTYYKQCE